MLRRRDVNTDEFEEFYSTHKDRCLRAAIASGMDRDRAEDAVAEAFARAWSRWRSVRTLDAPAAWVVRTAINANISAWRKRRREVVTDTPIDGAVSDAGAHPELLDAIRRLPPRQREVVILRYLLDLDTRTTAASLGVAPGTVGAHLHHALATLRGELAATEGIRT